MPGVADKRQKERIKKKKQRDKIKTDPIKHEEYKRKERERKCQERKRKREYLEEHPRLKEKEQEKKKLEMRAYRARKSEKNQDQDIETGRSEAAKKREQRKKDSKRKREERLEVKLKNAEKKQASLKMKAWRMKIKLGDGKEGVEFSSRSTEARAVKKAKRSLPHSPRKKAKIIQKLAASPRTHDILQKKGVVMSKKAKKTLKMGEAVLESLAESISDVKARGAPKESMRNANNVLRYVVNKAKNRAGLRAGVCTRLKLQRTNRGIKGDWWKPLSRKRKGLSNQIKQRVLDFYLSPEVSREVPDKRAAIKLKEGPKKVRIVQRHNMTMTLADAYEVYKKLFPEDKIGLTAFSKLRPVQVKKVAETSRRSCLCKDCCNAALKADALKKFSAVVPDKPEVLTSKHAVVDATLCEYEDQPKAACLTRACTDCGPQLLDKRYEKIITGNDDKEIIWHEWAPLKLETKTVTSCFTRTTTLTEFMTAYKSDLKDFPSHVFRSEWQQRQVKVCIDGLGSDEACLCMDYAESYQCRFQGEVQSAFFEPNCVTIHPMMAYYRQEHDGKTMPVKHAIIGITDDKEKDACGVIAFENAAISIIEGAINRDLKAVHEFTDGCAAQYKGKKAFYDISGRNSPQVVRNFYETSHGKSVCDGLGAVVKSSCYHAVISGRAIVKDADDFMMFCQQRLSIPSKQVKSLDGSEYISKRQFVFIKKSDVDRIRPALLTLDGTRKLHAIRSTGKLMALESRPLSCYCPSCRTGKGPCANKEHVCKWKEETLRLDKKPLKKSITKTQRPTLEVGGSGGGNAVVNEPTAKRPKKAQTKRPDLGPTSASGPDEESEEVTQDDFVAIYLNSQQKGARKSLFMAQIVNDISEDTVEVRFMESASKHDHLLYRWPHEEDISWEKKDQIIKVCTAPAFVPKCSTNRVQVYKFDKGEMADVLTRFEKV